MSNPSPAPVSQYAVRQTLNQCIKRVLVKYAVPAINQMLANVTQVSGRKRPVFFGPDQVIIGDDMEPSQAMLCIVGASEPKVQRGGQVAARTFITRILLKIPKAGDNYPEDFELVLSVVGDAIADAFINATTRTNTGTSTLPAVTDNGTPLLYGSAEFYDVFYIQSSIMDLPITTNADGADKVRGGVYFIEARLRMSLVRPNALGPGTAPAS